MTIYTSYWLTFFLSKPHIRPGAADLLVHGYIEKTRQLLCEINSTTVLKVAQTYPQR